MARLEGQRPDLPARLADVLRRLSELSGHRDGGTPLGDGHLTLDTALEEARRLLAERRGDAPVELCRVVLDLQSLREDALEADLRRRVDGLRGVQSGLAALHEIADPAQLYDAATAELCRHCGFDRAILFGVEGDELVAQSVHFAQDPAWAAQILALGRGAGRPQLSESILETEMLRRRAPAIVRDPSTDPRATRPLVEATRTRSYVAAPILPAGRVIGFLHADHHASDRTVDEVDRDILWAFAEGYGYAVERTLLRVHLAEERRRLRGLADAVAGVGEHLGQVELALGRPVEETVRATTQAVSFSHSGVGSSQFGLTRRELEVLELLAAGETNPSIARRLYISESTAKAHVKHILRKLGATNRAEAVARFVRSPAA